MFGILLLRGNHVEGYRSIDARLVDERQLPPRANRPPRPAADGRVTTMVLNGQTGAAIQKLRRESEGGDPEALTNLAAALLMHRPAVQRPSDSYEVSITLEALVAARKAIAQSPTLAAAHFHLALALARLGFTPEARVEFENAATLESDGVQKPAGERESSAAAIRLRF